MRFLYICMYITLRYSLRIYFKTTKVVNAPKERLGRTIYVSNHAASFMDPLVITSLRKPIVFFMTRSDVFTRFSKPFLWMAHMLPIYRQHDGEDTKNRNEEVFEKCARILKYGRNLLIFGEGFTDDVFIRRLKPIKKGAVRIGFIALENLNWSKRIYIAAVGANYTQPNLMRSEILVATSNKICLNDYKDQYIENPNKIINELTKEIEIRMQACITHLQNAADAPFHENIMQISRKGMHPTSSDFSISLEKRWRYSQQLAHFFNESKTPLSNDLKQLSEELDDYNKELRKAKIEDIDILEFYKKGKVSSTNHIFRMTFLSPLVALSLLHCWPVYFGVKRFVEKSFKRSVFYGSVKLLLGKIIMGLINIPFIFLFYHFIFPSWILALLYYAAIGLFFLAMVEFNGQWIAFKRKKGMQKADLSKFAAKRRQLEQKIHDLIPV